MRKSLAAGKKQTAREASQFMSTAYSKLCSDSKTGEALAFIIITYRILVCTLLKSKTFLSSLVNPVQVCFVYL